MNVNTELQTQNTEVVSHENNSGSEMDVDSFLESKWNEIDSREDQNININDIDLEKTPAEPQENQLEKNTKKAPSSWKKHAQESFAALPEAIQDEVLRRENDFHNGLQNYKNLQSIFEPYQPTMQQLGISPEHAVQKLLAVDNVLRNGSQQEKMEVLKNILNEYKIQNQDNLAPRETNNNEDLFYKQINDTLSQIKSKQADFDKYLQHQSMQETHRLNSEIMDFAKDKEFFVEVRDEMALLLANGKAKNLKEAYDKAVRLNDVVFEKIQSQQKAKDSAELMRKAADAKKAARNNVSSSSPFPENSNVGKGSIDDYMTEQYEKIFK
jgi:hypothetical protein